eukprot:m.225643 g.225643  ORF g.225643 m.225643 type:complete len:655 (+) comp25908_c0_seq4:143-2107(+)
MSTPPPLRANDDANDHSHVSAAVVAESTTLPLADAAAPSMRQTDDSTRAAVVVMPPALVTGETGDGAECADSSSAGAAVAGADGMRINVSHDLPSGSGDVPPERVTLYTGEMLEGEPVASDDGQSDGSWEDTSDDCNDEGASAAIDEPAAAAAAAAADQAHQLQSTVLVQPPDTRRVLLITNEVSKAAKPGDEFTNAKYEQLMVLVEGLLRKTVEPPSKLAPRVIWEHRLFDEEREGFVAPEVAGVEGAGDGGDDGDGDGEAVPFVAVDAREASNAELMREGVHSEKYLDGMSARTAEATDQFGDDSSQVLEQSRGKLLPSAGFSILTECAARAGAASLIDATLSVLNGVHSTAFVLCRPPTHHAVGNEKRCRNTSPQLVPYGFCHLNGISAAVAAARNLIGKQMSRNDPEGAFKPPSPSGRIVILDVDVHAGNGNEDTWYDEPDVLHVNFSEAQVWPGAEHGDPRQVGGDGAERSNLNFPMPQEEGDAAYCYALTQHALPAIRDFRPDLIMVACGFDALDGDPYASMALTPEWFGWLAAELHEASIAPFVFNLEGGYDPALCCEATTQTLEGLTRSTSAVTFLQRMKLAAKDGSGRPAKGTKTYSHRGVNVMRPQENVVEAVQLSVALHEDPSAKLEKTKKTKHRPRRGSKKS